MNAIEKLLECAKAAVSEWKDCDGSIRDAMLNLSFAVKEYESTKPIGVPVEHVAPDWAKWFSIDEDGWGDWSDVEPILGKHGSHWYSPGSECAGYFRPPEDCTKCRWHLEDGKWVQK